MTAIIFLGAVGMQYLYLSGRSEIYLNYHGKVYYLVSDKPTDDEIQDMIDSYIFIAS